MSAAKTIRRLGFRKWYERELLQSHANLVLLLLACLGLLGAAEAYSARLPFLDQIQIVLAALASSVIGVFALRRYLYLLSHAEYVANQADCEHCGTYARFELLGEHGSRLQVRCRKCRHEWHIEL
ncbi:hypothetical protein [uncultured Piscinibacter sp.]|uniref:hypothetical protein n=1 Tax=uncultured Piscinibacter sp. TaxID=1131835 RepID=UPI00260C4D42|nr:hypothetical protein [uncultured Piscinibacter sp.]